MISVLNVSYVKAVVSENLLVHNLKITEINDLNILSFSI